MEKIADIRAENGITFRLRLVRKGEAYGRNNCLTNEGEPLVEFYDTRFTFDSSPSGVMLGQFTGGRYYAETLLKSGNAGLILDGGSEAWRMGAESFRLAQSIIRNWLAR
ncbi:hypothetical protein RCXUPER_231 [Rhodobacter phage RcXuper]|nr:hypothetical protein RCXUPER_231 [Rhodobacter phage RcXuper]